VQLRKQNRYNKAFSPNKKIKIFFLKKRFLFFAIKKQNMITISDIVENKIPKLVFDKLYMDFV
jgi:hypothetical protein